MPDTRLVDEASSPLWFLSDAAVCMIIFIG
jgi:hypothetical protein